MRTNMAIFIFVYLSLVATCTRSMNTTCDSQDKSALADFSKSLESPIHGWGHSDCCTWDGVFCEVVSSSNKKRVVRVELAKKGLVGKISKSLAALDYLKVLNLSSNSLTDSIPMELFHFKYLEVLDLSSNYLTGNLTVHINLTSLIYLDLSGNFLYGSLNGDICGFARRLQVLDLSDNNFTGQIPATMGNCSFLETLSLGSNFIEGNLPEDLFRLQKLRVLDIHNNSLTGPILFNCSRMTRLKSLNLASNLFNGEILKNLSSCQSLTSLDLSRNNISSQLPESFKNLTSLSYLSLCNCRLHNLSSALTLLQHCKNLSALVFTTNFLDEAMPADLALHFNNLKVLVIANCRLTGRVPTWLSGCTKLGLVDFSWNQLSGRIPDIFSNLKFLFFLDLSNNSLSQGIPMGMTKLPSLICRNITLSEPSFDFPLFLKESSRPRALIYKHFQRFPPSLDLSSNFLSGPILPEFGNLKLLHVLKLKNNNLTGCIPDTLSGMTSLETLDLSHNNLTGTIPPSLVNLNFLSKFSVAYNHLSGMTPAGGQFSTFPSSSFEGNTHLCGYYPTTTTSCSRKPRHDSNSNNAVDSLVVQGGGESIISLPSPFGAATGFIIVVTALFSSGWVFPKPTTTNRI